MADVHDKKTRSYNMSKIRGKDTRPELLVRKFLHAKGYRYRLHAKDLPGKPDLVMPKYNTVVFIHGCFWHGHEGCRYFVIPETNRDWWLNKINETKLRDVRNRQLLRSDGWNIIELFECELKKDRIDDTLSELIKELKSMDGEINGR